MSSEPVASAGNYMPINIPQLSDYNLSPAKLYGFQIKWQLIVKGILSSEPLLTAAR
jgi:hypothetical protein